MSAPDTNPEKQAKRHRPAMIAIAASVLFGILMFTAIGFEATDTTDDPAVRDSTTITLPDVGTTPN